MRIVEPWTVSPQLTAERLIALAREPMRVRAEALPSYRPEVGDDPWSFGCVAYRRTCFAFKSLELSRDYPWLRVEERGLACRLFIDGEPLRFYCGDAQRPTSRSVFRSVQDMIAQGRLTFYEDELIAEEGEGWFWLLAIETAKDMSVLRVVILQANRYGAVRNLWEIPTETSFPVLGLVTGTEREPVDLPPPFIGTDTPIGLPAASDDDELDHEVATSDDVDGE